MQIADERVSGNVVALVTRLVCSVTHSGRVIKETLTMAIYPLDSVADHQSQ